MKITPTPKSEKMPVTALIGFGLCLALALKSSAQPTPVITAIPLKCSDKIIAIYSPGPRWESLQATLPDHLAFVSDQLKSGTIEVAGPLLDSEGVSTGGQSIYRDSDEKAIREIVELDPLISQHISTFTIKSWRMCQITK